MENRVGASLPGLKPVPIRTRTIDDERVRRKSDPALTPESGET